MPLTCLDLSQCEPGAIYEDARGRRYQVVGVWREPVIKMEAVDPVGGHRDRLLGGYRGLMWDGFKLAEESPTAGKGSD